MNNFSIGEMSKLHNISIQTLRYYDKIGLLKPKVINTKSNYRYYSIEQFIQVDLIKYCKNMGLSLEEIKKLLATNTSIEGMLHIINIQQEIIDTKLKEMNIIKNHLNFLKNKIASAIECENNKVFVKYNEERKYIRYDYIAKSSEELEINYRKAILDAEKNAAMFNYELASTVSYDYMKNKIIYENIMINTEEYILKNKKHVLVLPKGEYITIYFEGKPFENKEYYNKIIEYINENNIKVNGDFHEIYIIPQVDNEGREKTLTQLEILKSEL